MERLWRYVWSRQQSSTTSGTVAAGDDSRITGAVQKTDTSTAGFAFVVDEDNIAERLAIEAGERTDPDGWKFADGVFRMVSNADFMLLASAVREHVRDCFALEAMTLAGIENGTITEYSQIDAAFE